MRLHPECGKQTRRRHRRIPRLAENSISEAPQTHSGQCFHGGARAEVGTQKSPQGKLRHYRAECSGAEPDENPDFSMIGVWNLSPQAVYCTVIDNFIEEPLKNHGNGRT